MWLKYSTTNAKNDNFSAQIARVYKSSFIRKVLQKSKPFFGIFNLRMHTYPNILKFMYEVRQTVTACCVLGNKGLVIQYDHKLIATLKYFIRFILKTSLGKIITRASKSKFRV